MAAASAGPDRRQWRAFLGQPGSGGAVNRPGDSAADQQLGIGGIDDRRHVGLGHDIAFDAFHHNLADLTPHG